MSVINNLSGTVLRQAANIRDQIQALEAQLVKVLNSTTISVSVTSSGTAKKGISAAGKAKIIAAQKARWAKIHAAQATAKSSDKKPAVAAKPTVAAKPAKKKNGLSAAGKAKIIAAQKARWAKIKAEKKAEAK